MTDFRRRKTNERQMNQAIFDNVSLLLRCHAGTKQLKSILNANMFSKPNKSAFQEVTFYLLTVADPQLAKEKLKSWPLVTSGQEIQFRSELIDCVNVLNSKRKNADLPVFQPSHLVSPGGYRIGVFILKLSQLAIREHLTRAKIAVTLPPRISGNPELRTSDTIQVISETAAAIDAETGEKLVRFNTTQFRLREEAELVSCLIRKTKKEISLCRKELEETKAKHGPDIPRLLELEVAYVKQRVDKTLEIDQLFHSSKVLLDQLADLTLKHDPDRAAFPNKAAHLIPTRDGQLDLIQYFQGLTAWLEKFMPNIPTLYPIYVRQSIEKIETLLAKHQQTLQDLKGLKTQSDNFLKEVVASK